MNDSANNGSEATSTELEKPAPASDDTQFPPFPDPNDDDFEDDISEEERSFYKTKFPDLNLIKTLRLHCTACDRHLGCSARNEARMRSHPMLRTLVCQTCHTFYNSGEFEKGDDGSELYCRWCGQGGQVYCCSDCPHVFCAKCIKRNLGMPKIKEIENTDDWKCFKCNNKCLWDIRAACWALLRYCDLKNKITYKTQDPDLKEAYQKDCAVDHSECCKNKTNKRRSEDKKKKDLESSSKKAATAAAISKIPPTIQVKKFASINLEDSSKPEKKAQKRSLSPKNKTYIMKNQLTLAPGTKLINPIHLPPMPKKIRIPNATLVNPIRIQQKPIMNSYTRIKPKTSHMPLILNNHFNGFQNSGMFSNMPANDNINLSLESLTQGLDMAAVASIGQNNSQEDDLVCTPDFPLEPLCEVTEDNDDDVQCITPGPIQTPKINTPPPLVPRTTMTFPDLSPDNIIQMTENDVTVNAATGGLKFRVDPQTLSSNKMYRLPDGRIFAINANPNMPGGYSATIVAVTDNNVGKAATPKGVTYAAKLSAVSSVQNTSQSKTNKTQTPRGSTSKRYTAKSTKAPKSSERRECDLNVPVEWFRYNVIDAFDALEYSMSRIQKLKKEATTMYLRTRSVDEMKSLHRQLDRLLNTSATRFKEIRESINKEMKQYISKKEGGTISDDDDVEILNDLGDDDPIFIDENSMESNVIETNGNDTQEVDLTEVASSEHNDSTEKSIDHNETSRKDPFAGINEVSNENSIADTSTIASDEINLKEEETLSSEKTKRGGKTNGKKDKLETNIQKDEQSDENHEQSNTVELNVNGDEEKIDKRKNSSESKKEEDDDKDTNNDTVVDMDTTESKIKDSEVNEGKIHKSDTKTQDNDMSENKIHDTDTCEDKTQDTDMSEDKTQDTEENTEMSEEMIETLLKDNGDDAENSQNMTCLDIPEDFKEP